MSVFAPDIVRSAEALLSLCRKKGLKLAAAESCTGGLIAACFTEISGSSDVFDRGFVTYSNESKIELLGVKPETLAEFGAVSKETALEMAHGAQARSDAHIAVAVTGIAGPGGGSTAKPVGLVHIAIAVKNGGERSREYQFGSLERSRIRLQTVRASLALITELLLNPAPKDQ